MPLNLTDFNQFYVINKICGQEKQHHYLESLGFVPGARISILSELYGYYLVMVKGSKIGPEEMFHLLKRTDKWIVCEGVETKEMVDFLIAEGCDELQGFYYYKPMEQKKFEALLASMEELQKAIDYIDWKQNFYDDVLSGKIEYHSNLISDEEIAQKAQ